MDDFVLRALVAGVGVSLAAGPLGCFVVWRRMAYFGATLAHSALLGVALGLLFDVNVNLGIIAVCLSLALALVALEHDRRFASDTLLGILAHGALALGLVAVAFLGSVRVDLMSYLFGDILAVSAIDIAWIWGGGAACLAGLAAIWRPLLAITVQEDLARVEGVPVARVRTVFMVTIALVIALAMKIVGVLLIVSLLIIPAAAARRFASTPAQMAVGAALTGALSTAAGIGASLHFDTPAGPSIVVAAAALFFLSLMRLPHTRTG